MKPATRELLASRAEAWAFLAEPYHLSDWWPGIVSVEPDRRGFAVGARWQVHVVADPLHFWIFRFPRVGRPSGPTGSRTLVITAVDPLERWSFQLFRRVAKDTDRAPAPRTVEVTLRTARGRPHGGRRDRHVRLARGAPAGPDGRRPALRPGSDGRNAMTS